MYYRDGAKCDNFNKTCLHLQAKLTKKCCSNMWTVTLCVQPSIIRFNDQWQKCPVCFRQETRIQAAYWKSHGYFVFGVSYDNRASPQNNIHQYVCNDMIMLPWPRHNAIFLFEYDLIFGDILTYALDVYSTRISCSSLWASFSFKLINGNQFSS